ncbi:MAG: hypothetical protein ACI9Y1_000613 [Lentisphaeria bacterium]|jgi:hypothetical protein
MYSPTSNSRVSASGTLEQILLSTPFLIMLALISIIGAGPFFPLFDLDEGAFSEATREMLASGNWISTYLNDVPRHDKPILIYWFQAISASIFGINELAFRLPSMLASCLWLYSVFSFVREVYNDRTARIAVWIMATGWLYCIMFKAATADALLNLLLNVVFFEIYRYYLNPHSKKLILIGVYLGLGFLTKGPIAVALPILASLMALSWCGKFKIWLGAVIHPYSWLTFFVVITPWHIASYLDQGWGFFEGFYLGHNLGRFSQTMESHGGSPFYYLTVIPFIFLPFVKQLLACVIRLKNFASYDLLAIYLWCWFLLTLLIFSFSKTQLPHYMLYGLTPIVIFIAVRINTLSTKAPQTERGNEESAAIDKHHSLTFGDVFSTVVALVIFVGLPFILQHAIEQTKNVYEHEVISLAAETFLSSYVYISLALAIAAAIVMFNPRFSRLTKILLGSTMLMLNANFVLAPVMATAQQQPVYQAAKIAKTFDGDVVSFKTDMPSFSVYANRIVRKTDAPKPGDLVFARISAEKKLFDLEPNIEKKIIFNESGIALYLYGIEK